MVTIIHRANASKRSCIISNNNYTTIVLFTYVRTARNCENRLVHVRSGKTHKIRSFPIGEKRESCINIIIVISCNARARISSQAPRAMMTTSTLSGVLPRAHIGRRENRKAASSNARERTRRTPPSLEGRGRCIASATARGEESEVMRQKRVLITGSTKGLGLELANQFLREGDKVCVTSRSKANVNDVVLELQTRYGSENVCGLACDVCDHEQVSNLAKHCVENLGGIDFWINNAGTNGYEYNDIVDQDPSTIEEVVKTNALGTLLCCREAIRTMAEQQKEDIGYHIFNMEGAGSDGNETRKYAAYGYTKAGFSQLTKTLNKEMSLNEKMKDKMIKVHTISPGMVFTDLISSGRYAFGKQGRMFVNALAEPADVAASRLVKKIKTELENSQGKKSLTIKMLTPDVAMVKLFNRFVKQVGKDRYYPEDDDECEDVKTESIAPGKSVQSTMMPEAQVKLDDDVHEEIKEVEVAKEEVQENLSR